jgi:hypothetical protein
VTHLFKNLGKFTVVELNQAALESKQLGLEVVIRIWPRDNRNVDALDRVTAASDLCSIASAKTRRSREGKAS